jgi:elongation factor Ts
MTNIEKIKEVRERSGVGLGKCKKALVQCGGNVEEALVQLQKDGLLKAASNKKETREGYIYNYVHPDNQLFAIVEVNCQTDFCSRNDDFREFAQQCALQIASMAPKYLTSGDVPQEMLDSQREIFKAQVPEKVPADKVDHVINGKMKKWFSEVCLMDQKSVVVPGGTTMEQLRANLVMKVGENVVVRRFIRWKVGE